MELKEIIERLEKIKNSAGWTATIIESVEEYEEGVKNLISELKLEVMEEDK